MELNEREQALGSKRVDYNAGRQEVSRCRARGGSEESVACRGGSIQALKLRADVTRILKQGYRLPHKKGLMSSKIILK